MGAHEQFVNRKKNNIGTTHSESGWPGLSNVRRGLHARIAICMRAVPRFSRAMAPVCVQSHVRARGSRVLTCTSRWHACSGAYGCNAHLHACTSGMFACNPACVHAVRCAREQSRLPACTPRVLACISRRRHAIGPCTRAAPCACMPSGVRAC